LRREGIHRVVLVTHDVDMRRAIAEFATQGIDAIPAPTGMRDGVGNSLLDFLPSMMGLERSYLAIYEILGNLVRVAAGG
ncbi:MAG TPA: YdcF family protein, partial [Casimicrobiaceae bacterium]|nr:YdcF family protein [Casimicrobiaceae bacterium]